MGQMCKLRGATGIAIASRSKHDFVRELGADLVCDRNENLIDALADHKMTVYLDTFGGESIESSSR
jgi:NADPH:quinone reductase-like Zn-dependent oxidoreductase